MKTSHREKKTQKPTTARQTFMYARVPIYLKEGYGKMQAQQRAFLDLWLSQEIEPNRVFHAECKHCKDRLMARRPEPLIAFIEAHMDHATRFRSSCQALAVTR